MNPETAVVSLDHCQRFGVVRGGEGCGQNFVVILVLDGLRSEVYGVVRISLKPAYGELVVAVNTGGDGSGCEKHVRHRCGSGLFGINGPGIFTYAAGVEVENGFSGSDCRHREFCCGGIRSFVQRFGTSCKHSAKKHETGREGEIRCDWFTHRLWFFNG